MRALDYFLQRWRLRKALPYVRPGDRLLDLGCYDESLLTAAARRITSGTGIDPLAKPKTMGKIRILRGTVPGDHGLRDGEFDCITMLAVLEHIADKDPLIRECFRLLAPGGRVVLTIPRPIVDHILRVLLALRIVDGMSLEEHHDFDIGETIQLFQKEGFVLERRRFFQAGLNCLFVFAKG